MPNQEEGHIPPSGGNCDRRRAGESTLARVAAADQSAEEAVRRDEVVEGAQASVERGDGAVQRAGAAAERSEERRARSEAALGRARGAQNRSVRSRRRVGTREAITEASASPRAREERAIDEHGIRSAERDQFGDLREAQADERDRAADQRDRIADERDRVADARERLADERERIADERESRQAALLRETIEHLNTFAEVEGDAAMTFREAADVSSDPRIAERRRRLAAKAEAVRAWALERAERLERLEHQDRSQEDVPQSDP